MVLLKDPLRVISEKPNYLDDYIVITKHDNPNVIRIYIEMARKEVGVVLRYENLPDKPTDAFKPCKNKKQVAYDAHKIV